MNMETLIQNMDPNKIVTLIFNSSEEVQEAFVERFEKLQRIFQKSGKCKKRKSRKS